jgi:hypothetical protein
MNKNNFIGTIMVVAFSVFVFFSCDKNTKISVSDIPVIKLSDMQTVENLEFEDSGYFDKVEFVKLETTDESIFGEVTQMEIFENHIYILDDKGTSFKKFDMTGKYLHDIGRVGLGPGEYMAVKAFYINPDRKTINIYDPLKTSILRYDFSGKHIETVKLDTYDLICAARLSFLDNKELFCFSHTNWETNCEFSILNEKNYKEKCIYQYPVKNDNQISAQIADHPYTVRNEEVHYVLMFSDTVYSYSNNEISKLLVVESGKLAIKQEELSQIVSEKNNLLYISTILDAGKKGYTMGLKNIFESDLYMCCDFYVCTDYTPMAAILWNKTTNKGIYLSDYLTVSPRFSKISYCFDNTFVKIWDGSQISMFKEIINESNENKEDYPAKLWEILSNYNEDEDNPILIFYTMKK